MQSTKDSGHYRVVREQPRKQYLWPAIWIAVTVMLVISSWFYGRYDIVSKQADYAADNQRLKTLAREHKDQIDRLSQQVAIYEQGRKVDQKALEMARQEMLQLEERRSQLEKELVLYKSIIVPEQLAEGVRVQRLDLRPAEMENHYHLKMVLTQVAQKHNLQQGTLEAWVSGVDQNGEDQQLPLASLVEELDDPVRLGFRYFQSIPLDGGVLELKLPDGFRPALLNVLITLEDGRKARQIEQDFEWPAAEFSAVDGEVN
ncbi:DUF6776 family protein [Endozoicomonadaceae bacterium StTr2]